MHMQSRIYSGWVEHRRFAPRPHRFRYRLFMLYADLEELPRLFSGSWLFSQRHVAAAEFRRADYLAPAQVPLGEAVRDLVEARTGRRPQGAIRLLTHLRHFGYCMNPVSFYYCFKAGSQELDCIVAEITNTPWGERHQYVLPVSDPKLEFQLQKAFHVSPFMPMALAYRWRFNVPGPALLVHMQNLDGANRLFQSTLRLKAAPATNARLARALLEFPFMTFAVIAGIYWQAAKLWWKGTPFFNHPKLKEPCKKTH